MNKEQVDKRVTFSTDNMSLTYVLGVAKAAGVDVDNASWDVNDYGTATFNWTEDVTV